LITFPKAAIALSFAYPTINDNFVSQSTVARRFHNETRTHSETVYEWFAGRQRRIDTTYDQTTKITVYQFAQNHTEYIDVNGVHCDRRDFFEPWVPFFDWLKNSKQNGTCTVSGKSGQLWVDLLRNGVDITLCASGDTPLAFDVIDKNQVTLDVVTFNTFTPGIPPASNFQMPARCYTRGVTLF